MSFGIKVTSADRLCSLYVRYSAKWTCERCFKRYPEKSAGLQCSHFYGRSNKATRYYLPNLKVLCVGCHGYFTANPALHDAWQRKVLGEKGYKSLMVQANKIEKDDVKLYTMIYRKLLKDDYGIKV